jgi:hypothetical protein
MGDASLPKESYEVVCDGKVAQIMDWRTLSVTSKGRTRTTRALRPDKGHAGELEEFVRACKDGRSISLSWGSIEATTRATFAVERARVEGAGIEL